MTVHHHQWCKSKVDLLSVLRTEKDNKIVRNIARLDVIDTSVSVASPWVLAVRTRPMVELLISLESLRLAMSTTRSSDLQALYHGPKMSKLCLVLRIIIITSYPSLEQNFLFVSHKGTTICSQMQQPLQFRSWLLHLHTKKDTKSLTPILFLPTQKAHLCALLSESDAHSQCQWTHLQCEQSFL